MSREKEGQTTRTVAVVGSGLAGLTIAYLLHNDPRHRYSVVVFESGAEPSLDAASVNIEPPANYGARSRIDVPMRTFTGGYYRNLIAMYDHLGIHCHRQKFRFVFSKDRSTSGQVSKTRASQTYFIHASDNHEIPPPRPASMALLEYLAELGFVVLYYIWFAVCCTLIPVSEGPETFEQYLQKIRIPQRFIRWYLLPLMSAVATCSHRQILDFPASDVIRYRKLITGRKQYTLSRGVSVVQGKLVQGLDIRNNTRVTRIDHNTLGLQVTAEGVDKKCQSVQITQHFDHIILAVPPSVAAEIFEPARKQLARIPVRYIDTIVHRVEKDQHWKEDSVGVDEVWMKTSDEAGGWTEATHLHESGVGVTSCPGPNFSTQTILSRTTFVRTLRTPESRQITREMFESVVSWNLKTNEPKSWRNGDDGLWMVGAWCWDGMVLLEGAVVSAMRVASAFDVEIPWKMP